MKLQWTNFWPFAEKPWTICQETLDHMPRNPGPSAENANKSSAICQDCQGPSAKNANKSSAICQDCQGPSAENANKSSAICRDCQGLPLKYACQECRVFLGWPWLPITSETEFAKASQGPADELFITRTSQLYNRGFVKTNKK